MNSSPESKRGICQSERAEQGTLWKPKGEKQFGRVGNIRKRIEPEEKQGKARHHKG